MAHRKQENTQRSVALGRASHHDGEHPLHATPSAVDTDAAMAALHAQEKE